MTEKNNNNTERKRNFSVRISDEMIREFSKLAESQNVSKTELFENLVRSAPVTAYQTRLNQDLTLQLDQANGELARYRQRLGDRPTPKTSVRLYCTDEQKAELKIIAVRKGIPLNRLILDNVLTLSGNDNNALPDGTAVAGDAGTARRFLE